MNQRIVKGMLIAHTKNERIQDLGSGVWVCPSEASDRMYEVIMKNDIQKCTCPDFERRQLTCKHQYAVMHKANHVGRIIS